MKVMVIVKASKSSEAGVMPSEQLLSEMGKYNEELVKSGIMLAGEGLHPSSRGVRIRFSGAERAVINGPFAETKELIAGFWLWRVKSLDEAIEWVKRCPNPMLEESEIEIRQVFEADDFGENLTPELRENEAALRAQSLGLGKPRFVSADEFHFVGINETYSLAARAKIPDQWWRFVPHLGKIPGQVGNVTYGVSWNAKENNDFDYLTAVEVSRTENVPTGFRSLTLPARRYAVFSVAGHVSTMPQMFDTIFAKWVPDCGVHVAKAACFERYTDEFCPDRGTGGMEIWIPLD